MTLEATCNGYSWPGKMLIGQAAKVSAVLTAANIEHAFIGSFAVFTRNQTLADVMEWCRGLTFDSQDSIAHRESDLDIVVCLNKSHLIRGKLRPAGYAMRSDRISFAGCPLQKYRSDICHRLFDIDIFTTPLKFTYGTFRFGIIEYVDGFPLFPDDLLLLLKFQIYPFKVSDAFDLLCLAQGVWDRGEGYRAGVFKAIQSVVRKDPGLRWRVPLAVKEVLTILKTHGADVEDRLRGGVIFIEQMEQGISRMKAPWQLRWPRMARFVRSDPTIPREVESRD